MNSKLLYNCVRTFRIHTLLYYLRELKQGKKKYNGSVSTSKDVFVNLMNKKRSVLLLLKERLTYY